MDIQTEEKKEINTKFFDQEIKLFGTYQYNCSIEDISLTELIAVNSSKANVFIPHSSGRYQVKRFRKAQCPIVERITNSLMRFGRNTGKKNMAMLITKQAMDLVAITTGKNPLEIVLKAISLGAPRESSARTGSGGTAKKSAVDVSPMRRINQSIYLMCEGARKAAFRSVRNIAECLADEIMNCANGSNSSFAIRKKEETERSAKSDR